MHISGTVPKESQQGGPPGVGGGGPPRNINFKQTTVSGIDTSKPDLGLITPSQIQSGSYFNSGKHREAILNESYARSEQIEIGDKVELGGKSFKVVGLAKLPLGGQASDVYVRLGELQKLSDREGRINVLQVRASDSSVVSSVSSEIEQSFSGSQVDDRRAARRPRVRIARRRQEPVGQARHGARDRRPCGGVSDRGLPDALLGQQADARARHAQGDRLAVSASWCGR